MKKQKPPLKSKPKRTFENENEIAANYSVTDKQQQDGEQSYDNEGPFGIGQIKGKK